MNEYFGGLTLKELKGMSTDQMQKMTMSELKDAVRLVNKNVQNTMRRLEHYKDGLGGMSPALQAYNRAGRPTFKTRGMTNTGQLQHELTEGMRWLNLKTASAKGFTSYREKIRAHMPESAKGKKGGNFFDDADKEKNFWKNFTKVKERAKLYPNVKSDQYFEIAEQMTADESGAFDLDAALDRYDAENTEEFEATAFQSEEGEDYDIKPW